MWRQARACADSFHMQQSCGGMQRENVQYTVSVTSSVTVSATNHVQKLGKGMCGEGVVMLQHTAAGGDTHLDEL